MIDFVVDPKLDMTTAFFKKYASRVSANQQGVSQADVQKHLKASIFARDWALHRWPDSAKGRSRHQGRELEAEFGGEQQAPPPPSSPSPGH
jgi:G2/mitotic-specific cyclin 1/2